MKIWDCQLFFTLNVSVYDLSTLHGLKGIFVNRALPCTGSRQLMFANFSVEVLNL